jgi:hypothetical protein
MALEGAFGSGRCQPPRGFFATRLARTRAALSSSLAPEPDVGRIGLDAGRQGNFGPSALRGYAGPWPFVFNLGRLGGNAPALGVFTHAGGVLFHELGQLHLQRLRQALQPRDRGILLVATF